MPIESTSDQDDIIVEVDDKTPVVETAPLKDTLSTPEPAQEAKAKPADAEGTAEDEEDLGEYGERVRKRISKEVWKRREADRRAETLEARLQEAEQAIQAFQQRAVQSDDVAVTAREQALEGEYSRLQEAYRRAYDTGDAEEMLKTTERLADIRNDHRQIQSYKAQLQQYKQQQQPAPVVQQSVPKPDPKAMEWASNNDWFGKDVAKTGAAYAIDASLKSEGFDPNSNEYYEELDRRMAREFPTLRGTPRQSSQPVAGVSRTPASKTQVKLSSAEVAMAQRLGVPLAEYARYKR